MSRSVPEVELQTQSVQNGCKGRRHPPCLLPASPVIHHPPLRAFHEKAGECQAQSLRMIRWLVVATGLNNHEFAPTLGVVRLFASPGKVRPRVRRVCGPRICVAGNRLFEGINDR